jgi:protein-L-isoaspartate(D-aspartate) O-methyltransferase
VVTVDVDPRVVARASAALRAAGRSDVRVVCADGADGYVAGAPYDRVIATVGVWDLAPAWLDQLAPDGRLVVPLDLHGAQLSVAFEREGGHWVSRSLVPCGFMRLRGKLAGPERLHVLDPETGLVLSEPDGRAIDVDGIRSALGEPAVTVPTDVVGGGEAFSGVGLWLAVTTARSCVLSDEGHGHAALERALVRGVGFRATWGIVDGSSVALLLRRPVDEATFVLDAHGTGPAAERLAVELAEHVRAWDAAGRASIERLRVSAYPRGTPSMDDGVVIDKPHTRLVVSGQRPDGPAGVL